MRQKPVTIEVRKNGQHWAVLAEEQLIALTVYEKGARTLEAVLRGLLRYTSRKLFRLAVSDAMKGPKPAEPKKEQKADKGKTTPPKGKAKAPAKSAPVKKTKADPTTPSSPALAATVEAARERVSAAISESAPAVTD